MITERQIRDIIERAIPLDPKCAINRANQMERRARLRLDIEEMVRVAKPVPYEPRTEMK